MTSRFVDIFDRKDYSDICRFPQKDLHYISEYTLQVQRKFIKWKGNGFMKSYFAQAMYLQLLQELKPKTIIEFGTWQGGSAQWLYDMCRAIGVTTKVHTFANRDEIVTPLSEDIECHIRNNRDVDTYEIPFQIVEHPVLMIEDSHVNCLNLLKRYNSFLEKGDYLVIEDTHYFLYGLECKYDNQLKQFIHDSNLMVDMLYCDMFGYNMTDCVNSILKKF